MTKHDKYKRDRYEDTLRHAKINKIFERIHGMKPMDAALSGKFTQEQMAKMREVAILEYEKGE